MSPRIHWRVLSVLALSYTSAALAEHNEEIKLDEVTLPLKKLKVSQ